MEALKIINIVTEFSPFAFGRTAADGPNSGERFRNEFLLPNWDRYEKIAVDFSGFKSSPGSSFISSSFAGLVTKSGKTYDEVRNKIVILPKDSVYPSSFDKVLGLVKDGCR